MRTATICLALLVVFPAFSQQTDEVIVPQTGGARLWIPVAGHAQGQNGTFFRSEISVTNTRNVTQRVQLFWLPQGVTGPAAALQTYDLPAGTGFLSEDLVDRLLRQTGVGAIEVVGVTSANAFDPQARLHVTSRIWTRQPDTPEGPSQGTMSQTFPAVIAGQSAQSDVKRVYGMRRGAQYRLNVGVMNPSSTTQRFRIEASIRGGAGQEVETVEVDVKPRSIEHVLIPADSTGVATVEVIDLDGGAGDWQTWASSVDNVSGDAWSQMGFAWVLP